MIKSVWKDVTDRANIRTAAFKRVCGEPCFASGRLTFFAETFASFCLVELPVTGCNLQSFVVQCLSAAIAVEWNEGGRRVGTSLKKRKYLDRYLTRSCSPSGEGLLLSCYWKSISVSYYGALIWYECVCVCVFDLMCVLNYPFVEIRSQCHLQRRVFVCVRHQSGQTCAI